MSLAIQRVPVWPDWDTPVLALQQLARQPGSPPELLRHLAERALPMLWHAGRAPGSPRVAQELACVVYWVACNPGCPPDLWEQLLGNEHQWSGGLLPAGAPCRFLAASAAANPACTPGVLEQLAEHSVWDVRVAVAAHPGCTPQLLRRLRSSESIYVERTAYANPNSPRGLLEIKADQGLSWAAAALADRPDCPAAARGRLLRWLADGKPDDRQLAAASLRCAPRLLAQLARDTDRIVSCQAIMHPRCPPHIALQQLRRHTSKAKIGLACHPSTPGHIIRRLADDPVPGVRAAAAGHPLCPPAVLDRLARDPKPSVRAAVASSPVPASPATFERLAQDTAVAVRSAAAANLCCPSSQLSRLAQSRHYNTRLWVALNQATPPDTLAQLLQGTMPYVRQAAWDNPALPRYLQAMYQLAH